MIVRAWRARVSPQLPATMLLLPCALQQITPAEAEAQICQDKLEQPHNRHRSPLHVRLNLRLRAEQAVGMA